MVQSKTYHVSIVALLVTCSLFAAVPAMAQEETTHSRDDISQAKYDHDFADLSAETAGQVQAIYNRQPFPAGTDLATVHTREELAETMYDDSFEASTLERELTREQLLAVQNAYDAQFGALPEDPAHTRDDISQAMYGYDFADLSAETAGQVQALYNRQAFAAGTDLSELRTREQIAEAEYGTEYDALDDPEKRVVVENRYASQFADGEVTTPDEETPTETETESDADSPTETEADSPATTETPTETDTEDADTPSATATATVTATDSPTATATDSPTATATDSPTVTATATATDSPTATATDSPTETRTATDDGSSAVPDLEIVEIDAADEYVVVQNNGDAPVELDTVRINYETNGDVDQIRRLPDYTLEPGASVTIGTGDRTTVDADISTGYEGPVLNNDQEDTVSLLADDGTVIDEQGDDEATTSLLGGFFNFFGSVFDAVGAFLTSLF